MPEANGSSPPRIVVVRHGQTEWSESGQHTGKTDIPLTDVGRAQAAALRPALARFRFARILTSPRSRARETCQIALPESPAEIDPDLEEWDYGEYEGVTSPEIREKVPGWTIWTHRVARRRDAG